MKIRRPELVSTPDGPELRALVESAHPDLDGFTLSYRFTGVAEDMIDTRGDGLLAACLLPALIADEHLDISELTISPRLLAAADDLTEIYCNWLPQATRVRVSTGEVAPAIGGDGVGLFFSGGTDSFYSLLKDIDIHPPHGSVTHLIFVRGFQYYRESPALWKKILGRLERVADEAHNELVVVDSNVRTFTDHVVSHYLHSAADLASAALALSPLLTTCQISASYPFNDLIPYGQHPLIDPLWSTEAVEFVHVGAERGRLRKIRSKLAGSELALQNLIVCREDRSELNCGKCPKCHRVMLALASEGVLDRCTTLPDAIDGSFLTAIDKHTVWTLLESVSDAGRHPLSGDLERRYRRRVIDAEIARAWDGFLEAMGRRSPRLTRMLGRTAALTSRLRPSKWRRS